MSVKELLITIEKRFIESTSVDEALNKTSLLITNKIAHDLISWLRNERQKQLKRNPPEQPTMLQRYIAYLVANQLKLSQHDEKQVIQRAFKLLLPGEHIPDSISTSKIHLIPNIPYVYATLIRQYKKAYLEDKQPGALSYKDPKNKKPDSEIWHDLLDESISWLNSGFRLANFLFHFPAEERYEVITALGHKIYSVIEEGNGLACVLDALADENRYQLILDLGAVKINALINEGRQLARVLYYLSSNERSKFVAILGQDKVRSIIHRGYDLAVVLTAFSKNERYAFITSFGDRVREVLQDGLQLATVLEELSNLQERYKLINLLGAELFATTYDLAAVLKQFPQEERFVFIKKLGDQMSHIIRDGLDLALILEQLPDSERFHLITDQTRAIIVSGDRLAAVLKQLPPHNRTDLIHNMKEHMAELLENGEQLTAVLVQLNSKDRLELIELLDVKMSAIIKDYDQLIHVLEQFPYDRHYSLINALGEKIKDIIKYDYQLIELLRRLPQDRRYNLLITLGDSVNKIVLNDTGLVGVLTQLPTLTSEQLQPLTQLFREVVHTSIKYGNELHRILSQLPDDKWFLLTDSSISET